VGWQGLPPEKLSERETVVSPRSETAVSARETGVPPGPACRAGVPCDTQVGQQQQVLHCYLSEQRFYLCFAVSPREETVVSPLSPAVSPRTETAVSPRESGLPLGAGCWAGLPLRDRDSQVGQQQQVVYS